MSNGRIHTSYNCTIGKISNIGYEGIKFNDDEKNCTVVLRNVTTLLFEAILLRATNKLLTEFVREVKWTKKKTGRN